MSAPAQASLAASGGLAPALSAVGARLGLVALLFAVAGPGLVVDGSSPQLSSWPSARSC